MGASLDLVKDMEAALGRSETDMRPWFHEEFVWDGNTGCGVKAGVKGFFDGWQKPYRAAFADRVYKTERWLEDGDWVACFGTCEARHTGEFLGIAPTGKAIRIPYIDFWEVRDGRIAYNKVSVDFANVAAQLGRDLFGGEGWERFDPDATPSRQPSTQGNDNEH